MNKYISVIDLGEKANFFAYKIGIIAIEKERYVCEALDYNADKLHTQLFTLKKTIDGLPANNASLISDVLKAWDIYIEKIQRNSSTQ